VLYNPARALSLLNKRFGGTIGFTQSRLELGPITPVTDLDALALVHRATSSPVTVDANVRETFYEVPEGERWHMEWLDITSLAADYVYRPEFGRRTLGTSGGYIALPLQEAVIADGTGFVLNCLGIKLAHGDRIDALISSYVSGSTLTARIMYWLEECTT